jgi:hypothetical protein
MKPILNEQLARMQKLAGIITENVNEAITLDPNKLKAFTMAVNAFGGSRGDKADFLKIAKLLSSNQLAKAAEAIQRVDTSPREIMYDIMMDTYPELHDMLFDNEEGDYIALATPKAGLPENEINIGQKNVIKQYLSKFRKFAQDNTADDADLKNLKTAVGRFYKELGL